MTYEKIVEKAIKAFAKADTKKIANHLAIQFNVTGEGEGAFYLEVNEGKVDIQPYEYYDRTALVWIPSEILIKILDGKLTFAKANEEFLFGCEGWLDAVLALDTLKAKKAPARKPAAKKTTAAKKPAAKKATTAKKPAAKKPAAKAPAKKATTAKKTTTAKKPVAKKTTKK